jgi:hypothetical protein
MGDLQGLFVATQEEVDAAIGEDIYFGEILGKHSEVFGELYQDDIRLVSEETDKIEWLMKVLDTDGTISGYNPLEYVDA